MNGNVRYVLSFFFQFKVSLHRVVNIVTRNSVPQPGADYDRRFTEDDWYSDSQDYPDARGHYEENSYQPNDHQYYEDDNYDNFQKNHFYQNNVRQAWCGLFRNVLCIQFKNK